MKPQITKEIVGRQMREDGIEFILAQFVDINGAVKVKQVPAGCFDDLVENGAGFAGAAVWGMGQGPHSHDLMGRADIETYRRLPWKKNVGVVNTNIHVDGKPHPYCPRWNLVRMSEIFAGQGYVLNCGFEPEHFLVVRNSDGSISIWDPLGIDTLPKPCYDFKGMCQAMDYLQDIIRYGNELGFDIYQSDHEDANGQYEINYGWTNALHSADRLTLFRMMTSQVAAKYGCLSTYMAKPFADKTGSAAHLHFHVANVNTGENLFPLAPGEKDTSGLGLSKLALHYAGGLLKHIRAITAVASPTVNCYRRIQSGEFVYSCTSGYTWTPAFACYGDNNRTQMLRSPNGERFEDRSISAAVNPYLLTAVHMAAGLDGIKNEIDPGEPCVGVNLYEMPFEERRRRGMTGLPQNLSEAISALEEDEVVKSALGPIAEEFIRLKRSEWSEFMRHQVTPWEIKRYLSML